MAGTHLDLITRCFTEAPFFPKRPLINMNSFAKWFKNATVNLSNRKPAPGVLANEFDPPIAVESNH